MTEPSLVHDLDNETYHRDETTLSASGAKILLGKRPPSPDGEALQFGTLVHTVILEPHKLETYAVLDPREIGLTVKGEKSDNPTATKAWKDAVHAARRDGLTVISPQTLAHAQAMAAAVENHPEAARLLAAATDHEVSAYATHPSGAPVRARFDLIGEGFIADIKTCRDANPDGFDRVIHSLLYHVSAAHYIDVARANGKNVDRFDFICVEKEPTPGGDYRVSVIELDPYAIERGRELMAEACDRWLALGKRIDLPGYGEGRHVVDLPPWGYDNETVELNLGGLAS